MEVIYGLIPAVILVGLIAVGVLLWAARSGQFEDLEGEAHRILMDDDENKHTGSELFSETNDEAAHDKGEVEGIGKKEQGDRGGGINGA